MWHQKHAPHVWANDAAEVELKIPEYSSRRELTARDQSAVAMGFHAMARAVMATLLGVRACPRCPECNCAEAKHCGTHPSGGVFVLCTAFCGAIEYQGNSTPHFHANIYLASVWQQPWRFLPRSCRRSSSSRRRRESDKASCRPQPHRLYMMLLHHCTRRSEVSSTHIQTTRKIL